MRYTPTPNPKPAQALMWALIAVGSAVFCLPAFFPTARAGLQLVALILFCTAVYVAVRYLLTTLHYEIALRNAASADDGIFAADGIPMPVRHIPASALDFTVRKASGRRAAIIDACLPLDNLVYFAPLPREGGRNREPYRLYPAMRVFSYTASLRPSVTYIAVFVDEKNNAIGLHLEPSDEMIAFLTDIAAKSSTQT